ncbi:interferon-inducible GTPase-domain-containing protein [Hygrophoropsis aurantiaca]|uniref:Interferon-inducible GTPase-domain-containing protein n=1 Tax=Hygrophoropsis aurantiaca TaxID=72124 RepID=A0ACB7ZUB2_9AGAM|nr:interferon-inducible GTPase-domain-containing protein [Hygrophoropsis aurantiaca]
MGFLDILGRFVPFVPFIASLFSSKPSAPNPTIQALEDSRRAQAAQAAAEQSARDARAEADRILSDARAETARAKAAGDAAKEATRIANETAARERATQEAAINAANAARDAAQAQANASTAETAKFAQQAELERLKAKTAQEEAQRATQAAREAAERQQRVADEDKKRAHEAQQAAEKQAREADSKAKQALDAQKEAERKLREGVQPVVAPTEREIEAAKRKMQWKDDLFHFAIAGVAGGGKSSLINAFRGMRNKSRGAAATGITETTLAMARYPDSNPDFPFVWYDIPGAGTLKIPDWQYFNAQGLYVFDCIMVLFDNRFTMTDIAILTNAKRFKIPTYIIRSKSDQHIQNMVKEMAYESDGDEDEDDRERQDQLYKAARTQFIADTRRSVKVNLQDANLPDQRVYIVSNETLLGIVKDKKPKKAIDEVELLMDLYNEAHARRYRPSTSTS